MATLFICQSLQEALTLQSHLRGSGIEAFIPNEFTVQNDWGLINAIGGIEVQVPEADLEKAREIMAGKDAV